MGEIAEGIHGRLAGAIKQFDSEDALTEEQADAYARDLAEQFESIVKNRHSSYVQDELSE